MGLLIESKNEVIWFAFKTYIFATLSGLELFVIHNTNVKHGKRKT